MDAVKHPWYDFVGATALFMTRTRVEVCRWLLDNGLILTREKFPGISIFSSLKTLNAADVIGQSLHAPRQKRWFNRSTPERRQKAAERPCAQIHRKSTRHTWTDMVPWRSRSIMLMMWCATSIRRRSENTAIVKKVNVKESRDAVQTYKLLYEPPTAVTTARIEKSYPQGELDTEVLYVFKDGKDPVPLRTTSRKIAHARRRLDPGSAEKVPSRLFHAAARESYKLGDLLDSYQGVLRDL